MAYNTTKIIASGAWAQVRVKKGDGDQMEVIGLCTDANFNENFNLQEAAVLGYLGPISIDSQGYRCNIQIGTFIPEETRTAPDVAGIKADTTLYDLAASRGDVQADGKGRTFAYMDFYNSAVGEVIAAFNNVIVSDYGARVSPNAYVTSNMSFLAMERTQ